MDISPSPTGLQVALDSAVPGDRILLQPGTEYVGNFTAPAKSPGAVITITTDTTLPNERISPAAVLGKIVAPNSSPALQFLPNADNYKIDGVEFTVASGIYSNDIIRVGSLAATAIADQPDNIEFDRVYVHGDPTVGSKRGAMISTNQMTVQRSYFSDFKAIGQDTMAMAVNNAFGPFVFDDNYLEAAGYPIIFGGANNKIPEILPTDITFTNNLCSRPAAWQAEGWTVKNLFEIKIGRQFLIENNVFQNNWASAQVGFAILIEPVFNGLNSDGTRFAIAEDIIFRNNVVRSTPHGMNLSKITQLLVYNNLFVAIPGRLFQLLGTMNDVQFHFNTALDTTHTAFVLGSSAVINNFILRGNIINFGTYGIKGGGSSSGNSSIAANMPGAVIDTNVFIEDNLAIYPAGNYFVDTVAELGLVDYVLPAESPYKGIVSGADPGYTEITPVPPPDPEIVETLTVTISENISDNLVDGGITQYRYGIELKLSSSFVISDSVGFKKEYILALSEDIGNFADATSLPEAVFNQLSATFSDSINNYFDALSASLFHNNVPQRKGHKKNIRRYLNDVEVE